MWPFQQTPTKRFQHRLLKRLRVAYLVTEDLASHRLVSDNLKLLGRAAQQAADDETLYAHWFGQPMPLPLASAVITECKAWNHLFQSIHELVTQGFHPEAFQKEAEALRETGHLLQDVIQYQLNLITHPERKPDERLLRLIKARLKL
jgi:uncharacterized protein YciW